MTYAEQEVEALAALAPKLQRDGFRLVELGQLAEKPEVFRRYKPDAVFQDGTRTIVVEFKLKRTPAIEKQLAEIKKEVEAKPNWEFRVEYLDETASARLPVVSKKVIEQALIEANREVSSSGLKSAFLLTWAAFEAAGRRLHSRIFSKPQTPGRIITVLAERGFLLPDEASALRELSAKRNSLIHGNLEIALNPEDQRRLSEAVNKLLNAK